MLPPTSRYASVGTTTLTTAGGTTIVYLERRFVPQARQPDPGRRAHGGTR